jgi:2-succinyl-6-hydroxy-2,4-cyclohexadiene-1-carboxylate synthase
MPASPPPSIPPSETPPPEALSPGPRSEDALHTETIGRGPRVVLAHGFTQTGRVWGSLETRLAADHQVVLVDMPGHGGSDRVRATLPRGAGLLADAGGRATYLGYSMGARVCLHLALARPGVVDGLVLVSGTAGIEDGDERRARRQSDEAMAEDLDPADRRSPARVSVESFVRRWLENPMFAGIGPGADGLSERLTNTGPGLASSLRLAGTGTQRPHWASLPRLRMPVLIVTGGRDAKFTALGQRMARSIGANAVHAVVAGAGHAPHLERPEAVADLVRAHLAGNVRA